LALVILEVGLANDLPKVASNWWSSPSQPRITSLSHWHPPFSFLLNAI
jgi:hypothetical protein